MTTPTRNLRQLPMFTRDPWQMSYGERAVIEGLLSAVKPRLSIEIGRAEGGSLRRIAAHSEHVISFDLVPPAPGIDTLDNVTLKIGDGHSQLPEELSRLAALGANVDFVLVDGDHSSPGVRADMIDLLESDAIRQTVIIAHDSINEHVRGGLESVPYEQYEKVRWVDLDFVPGGIAQVPGIEGQCWGGIGLVIVDTEATFHEAVVRSAIYYPASDVLWPWAQTVRDGLPSQAG